MNYFVLVNSILYFAASGWSLYNGHGMYSVVWFSYAVSAGVMFFMEV